MTTYQNPFPSDPDRRELWEMLVRRDIEAFVAGDWARVEPDFDAEHFYAVDGQGSANPASWRIGFAGLDTYREAWLEQSRTLTSELADVESALYAATTLRDIEIVGDRALLHKRFDGHAERRDGSRLWLNWQTLYQARKRAGRWQIVGFIGYLPNPMGALGTPATAPGQAAAPGKRVPPAAAQHSTAGPYSPVLDVDVGRIVVVSGQAAIADDGSVVGQTIEEQTRVTLENCRRQLASAGTGLHDVFKVNVYLADLRDWDRFNAVYRELMPSPLPVRTAVGVNLLLTLQVEIEMWAVRP